MKVEGYPFRINGTIKGITKKQAKELFNFDLPKGAKGMTFRTRGKANYMVPYYPDRFTVTAPKMKEMSGVLGGVGRIGSQILKEVIHPIWNKEAKRTRYSSGGYWLFKSINMKLVQDGWERLQISTGALKRPAIASVKYYKYKLNIKVKTEEQDFGIVILNTKGYKTKHLSPRGKEVKKEGGYKVIEIDLRGKSTPIDTKSCLVYVYSKRGDEYSKSVCGKIDWGTKQTFRAKLVKNKIQDTRNKIQETSYKKQKPRD